MTEKKTGTFDMTFEEKELWDEACVAVRLAGHYEQMARDYNRIAATAQEKFWNHIRRTRDLPIKESNISVQHARRLVITLGPGDPAKMPPRPARSKKMKGK